MKNIFKKRRERITLFRGQNKREDAYKAKEIPDDLFRICKRCKTQFRQKYLRTTYMYVLSADLT